MDLTYLSDFLSTPLNNELRSYIQHKICAILNNSTYSNLFLRANVLETYMCYIASDPDFSWSITNNSNAYCKPINSLAYHVFSSEFDLIDFSRRLSGVSCPFLSIGEVIAAIFVLIYFPTMRYWERAQIENNGTTGKKIQELTPEQYSDVLKRYVEKVNKEYSKQNVNVSAENDTQINEEEAIDEDENIYEYEEVLNQAGHSPHLGQTTNNIIPINNNNNNSEQQPRKQEVQEQAASSEKNRTIVDIRKSYQNDLLAVVNNILAFYQNIIYDKERISQESFYNDIPNFNTDIFINWSNSYSKKQNILVDFQKPFLQGALFQQQQLLKPFELYKDSNLLLKPYKGLLIDVFNNSLHLYGRVISYIPQNVWSILSSYNILPTEYMTEIFGVCDKLFQTLIWRRYDRFVYYFCVNNRIQIMIKVRIMMEKLKSDIEKNEFLGFLFQRIFYHREDLENSLKYGINIDFEEIDTMTLIEIFLKLIQITEGKKTGFINNKKNMIKYYSM